jgi:hypothetical protein
MCRSKSDTKPCRGHIPAVFLFLDLKYHFCAAKNQIRNISTISAHYTIGNLKDKKPKLFLLNLIFEINIHVMLSFFPL